jgi:hypothetical protein
MRLGLAVLGAAAVIGGYALVNSVSGRPAAPAPGSDPGGRSWSPSVLDEPAPAARTYELIRYVNPDGSFGMVDDPTRVPRGATIIGRERKTAAAAEPAEGPDSDEAADVPAEPAPGPLSAAERRVMEAVLETGLFPDGAQLERMEDDLDEVERERAAARVPAAPPRR